MNSISVNLHGYYNKFANLHIFNLTNGVILGAKCVKLSDFSILHCMMQMLKIN